jgi:hypothetical protein
MKTPFALTGKSSCDLPHYFTNSFYPRCHFPINGNWESTGKASFQKRDFSGVASQTDHLADDLIQGIFGTWLSRLGRIPKTRLIRGYLSAA